MSALLLLLLLLLLCWPPLLCWVALCFSTSLLDCTLLLALFCLAVVANLPSPDADHDDDDDDDNGADETLGAGQQSRACLRLKSRNEWFNLAAPAPVICDI